MENEVMVPKSVLRAAMAAAAKLDVRYYLNGVAVIGNAETTTVVATDGVIMFAAQYAQPAPGLCVVLEPKALRAAMLGKTPNLLSVGENGMTYCGEPVKQVDDAAEWWRGGHWKRAIPALVSGGAATYGPEVMARVARVISAAQGRSDRVKFFLNGKNAAVVPLSVSKGEGWIAMALVMPMEAPRVADYPASDIARIRA